MSVAALVEGLSISSAGKGSMTQSLLADQLSAAFVVHSHLMSSALKANGARLLLQRPTELLALFDS